ncbi:FUSC family protein [Microbacteriaceae bacterium 4G12]
MDRLIKYTMNTILSRKLRDEILRLLVGYAIAQITTYALGYGTSPTCLISVAMVLLSVPPIEAYVQKKALERVYSNLIGAAIGIILSFAVETSFVRVVIGGIIIILISYFWPKINFSPASASVALLIVTEVSTGEAYRSMVERALLVVIGCLVGYITIRYIIPPRHHTFIVSTAKQLSLKFIFSVKYQLAYVFEDHDLSVVKAALYEAKKETVKYEYIIKAARLVSDEKFKYLSYLLASLEKLEALIEYIIKHDETFHAFDNEFKLHYLREIEQTLNYHVSIISPKDAYECDISKVGETVSPVQHISRNMISFLTKLDTYANSLDKLNQIRKAIGND